MKFIAWSVLVIPIISIGPTAFAQSLVQTEPTQRVQAATDAAPAASKSSDGSKDADNKQGKGDELVFVRVTKDGKKLRAMQTAVITYSNPVDPTGAKVTLIGAVHIAEPDYYSQLNTLFQQFDALLYEMVMEPGQGVPNPQERGVSPVSTIQVGMKDALGLTFQLDEINYKAKNFVHADMTPKEFFDTMNRRKEGLMQLMFRSLGAGIAMQSSGKANDISLLTAAIGSDPQKGLRRALAEQMVEMDGQMAGLSGNDGKSTLITERNAKAMDVLQQEIKKGKKNLGIFYGAGHLKDMHERLEKEYGMKPEKVDWLDAWNLR